MPRHSIQRPMALLMKSWVVVLIGAVAGLYTSCQTTQPTTVTLPPPPPHGYTTDAVAAYPSPNGPAAPYTQVDANGLPVQTSVQMPPVSAPVHESVLTSPAAASRPHITARAAILVDGRGRVLYEKNADMQVPAASTQKLLLAILVAERGDLGRAVTIQHSDTQAEPTVLGIKAGQVYTRQQLLDAVLIRSCNDVAKALGRDHSGSESAFAAAMNVRARQLGMNNSYFTNASGLPSPPGQYSTARDLAILGAVAMQKPVIRRAVGTKSMVFRFPDGTTRTLNNTNQVLRNFPHCTGAKTGFTNAAGRCLVSTAEANGRHVVAVILGSKTPTVWTESEALLRYGLSL